MSTKSKALSKEEVYAPLEWYDVENGTFSEFDSAENPNNNNPDDQEYKRRDLILKMLEPLQETRICDLLEEISQTYYSSSEAVASSTHVTARTSGASLQRRMDYLAPAHEPAQRSQIDDGVLQRSVLLVGGGVKENPFASKRKKQQQLPVGAMSRKKRKHYTVGLQAKTVSFQAVCVLYRHWQTYATQMLDIVDATAKSSQSSSLQETKGKIQVLPSSSNNYIMKATNFAKFLHCAESGNATDSFEVIGAPVVVLQCLSRPHYCNSQGVIVENTLNTWRVAVLSLRGKPSKTEKNRRSRKRKRNKKKQQEAALKTHVTEKTENKKQEENITSASTSGGDKQKEESSISKTQTKTSQDLKEEKPRPTKIDDTPRNKEKTEHGRIKNLSAEGKTATEPSTPQEGRRELHIIMIPKKRSTLAVRMSPEIFFHLDGGAA